MKETNPPPPFRILLVEQAAMRKAPSPLLFLIPAGSETLAAAAIKAGAIAYIIKDPSRGYLNLLPVAVPEAVKRYWDRSVVIEVEYYRKNGATLWMENRVQAIRNSENAIVGIMGVSRDITERREAEAALRESEKKYRTLFENAPIGIGITDGVGNILDYNEAMLNLHRYKQEDTLPSGRTVDYYHNPEERERRPSF